MNKAWVLKDEYESAEWDNLTPEGEERAFPFGTGDETFTKKNSKLQSYCWILWLRIEFISLTNWFLTDALIWKPNILFGWGHTSLLKCLRAISNVFVYTGKEDRGGCLRGDKVPDETGFLSVGKGGGELDCLWCSVLATSLPNQHLLWSPNKKQEHKGTRQQGVMEIVSWNPSPAWKPELKVWIYWLYNSRAITSRMLHLLMRQKRKINKCLGSEVRQIWIWILLRLRFPYLWSKNITLLY